MIAGVDEAGCGTLIGPLVASAVCLPEGFDASGIKDSKKLTAKKRIELCAHIRREAVVGVGIITLDEINANPFGEMRKLAFERAVQNLILQTVPSKIIIDGSGFFDGVQDIPFECIPKADGKHLCVSAASIVAKTVRDKMVDELCEHDRTNASRYGWSKNKGYPTQQHLLAIRDHGTTIHHRTSFKPCRDAF
jgi:ribonuclease HII